MTKVLKAGGVWLLIAAVVWLITIWRWQTTALDVSAQDIVLQLFVLPVLLAGALLAALWGVRQLREQAAGPASSTPRSPDASATSLAGGAVLSAEESLRQARIWVLDTALNLRVGHQGEQALAALATGEARPGLDSELQDVDGLPVFSARVDQIDDGMDAMGGFPNDDDTIAPIRRADGSEPPQAVRRALSLLSPVLAHLLDSVAQLVPDAAQAGSGSTVALSGGMPAGRGPLPGTAHDMRAHLSGVAMPLSAASALAREAQRPTLTVRLLLPPTWAQADLDLALQWAKQGAGSLLDWAEASGARAVRWQATPLATPEALWDEVDALVTQWHREPRPELLLVLALDSTIDADQVAQREGIGQLFTAQNQTGLVPGEGAAGALLASPAWRALDLLAPPPLHLWRPVRTRRDKSADALGRTSTTAMEAALAQAIALSAARPEALQIVADSDHRASRSAELYQALQTVLPGLDPMRQVHRLGEACGELGMARALAPLALACAALTQSEDPEQVALAALLQSPHERVVLALAPRQAASVHDAATDHASAD
jgi:hypothetical protein